VVLDDSTISASVVGGDGGNITIVSDYFFATESSELNVTSELSNEGTIVIDSPDTDIVSEITALPESYLDAAELLRQRCETQHRDRLSGRPRRCSTEPRRIPFGADRRWRRACRQHPPWRYIPLAQPGDRTRRPRFPVSPLLTFGFLV
ncbi:MAG: hypothetical protein JRG94_22900, partial [Deltaproteobacteria bacterium]|nr:hypothetical protein [Deltaproteobacteria bacterium]